VVSDLEHVKAGWAKLGFPAQDLGEVSASGSYLGQYGSSRFRVARARLADAEVLWIQPLESASAFSDHLARHGDGVHHLAFDVPDIDAAGAFFASKGAPVVQSGAWGEKGKPGSGRFAYAATDAFGGVTTEFLWNLR
jgi:hypothetical protein